MEILVSDWKVGCGIYIILFLDFDSLTSINITAFPTSNPNTWMLRDSNWQESNMNYPHEIRNMFFSMLMFVTFFCVCFIEATTTAWKITKATKSIKNSRSKSKQLRSPLHLLTLNTSKALTKTGRAVLRGKFKFPNKFIKTDLWWKLCKSH